MNKSDHDNELESILQEARTSYQKRIKSLKSSMRSIYKGISKDSGEGPAVKETFNRHDSDIQKELMQTLSKIQVLQIENENLKTSIFSNPSPGHNRRSSCDVYADNLKTSEVFKLKDLLSLSERENKELNKMVMGLKAQISELEENSLVNRQRISELIENNFLISNKLKDSQDYAEQIRKENEKLMNDAKSRFNLRYTDLENEKKKSDTINYTKFSSSPSFEEIRKHYKFKISVLNSKIKILSDEVLKNQEKFDAELAHLIKITDEEKESIKNQANSLSVELDKANSDLIDSNNSIKDLKSQISSLTETLKLKDENINNHYIAKELHLKTINDLQLQNSHKISQMATEFDLKTSEILKKELENKKTEIHELKSIQKAIEADFINKIQEESEKSKEFQYKLNETLHENSELLKNNQNLIKKCYQLENEHQIKNIEFQKLYEDEIARHKADVRGLELEVQNLYETNGKYNTFADVFKEKYNILKLEYSDIQQKFHLNTAIYEKQLEEFKKNYAIQEREIMYLRNKDTERKKQLEISEKNIEKLLAQLQTIEETKSRSEKENFDLTDSLQSERQKLSRMQEGIKVTSKQFRNGFLQILKLVHRSAFEELVSYKKYLSEVSQSFSSKLTPCIKSLTSAIDAQKAEGLKTTAALHQVSEDLKSLNLKLNQANREISIRDERISYLENSLKTSLLRNRYVDQAPLRTLLSQVALLEEKYSDAYNEIIEVLVVLKSQIQKDFISVNKENLDKLERKNSLLRTAKTEIIKILTDIDKIELEKAADYAKHHEILNTEPVVTFRETKNISYGSKSFN